MRFVESKMHGLGFRDVGSGNGKSGRTGRAASTQPLGRRRSLREKGDETPGKGGGDSGIYTDLSLCVRYGGTVVEKEPSTVLKYTFEVLRYE